MNRERTSNELREQLEHTPSSAARLGILREAARTFHEKHFGIAETIELLEHAQHIDPTDSETMEMLDTLYVVHGETEKLARLIERRLTSILSRRERLDLLKRYADLCYELSDQPEIKAISSSSLPLKPTPNSSLDNPTKGIYLKGTVPYSLSRSGSPNSQRLSNNAILPHPT